MTHLTIRARRRNRHRKKAALSEEKRQAAYLDYRVERHVDFLEDNGYWDEEEDPDAMREDALEQLMDECGYTPDVGFCVLSGTEFCDFECPFRD